MHSFLKNAPKQTPKILKFWTREKHTIQAFNASNQAPNSNKKKAIDEITRCTLGGKKHALIASVYSSCESTLDPVCCAIANGNNCCVYAEKPAIFIHSVAT